MLTIELYPACLDCVCPNFTSSNSTTIMIDKGEIIDQSLKCSHRYVCKYAEGQDRIDLREALSKEESCK